jgi:hypothetical protein
VPGDVRAIGQLAARPGPGVTTQPLPAEAGHDHSRRAIQAGPATRHQRGFNRAYTAAGHENLQIRNRQRDGAESTPEAALPPRHALGSTLSAIDEPYQPFVALNQLIIFR